MLTSIKPAFRRLLGAKRAPYLLAIPTYFLLRCMHQMSIQTSTSLAPPIYTVAFLGLFFAFGWLLYECRDAIGLLRSPASGHFVAAIIATVLYLIVVLNPNLMLSWQMRVLGYGLTAVTIWLLVYSLIGTSMAIATRSNGIIRYLSDASYWIFIVHWPINLWMTTLLTLVNASLFTKLVLVLCGNTFFSLLSYDLLVRSTFVGALLNGQRRPRQLTSFRNWQETVWRRFSNPQQPAMLGQRIASTKAYTR